MLTPPHLVLQVHDDKHWDFIAATVQSRSALSHLPCSGRGWRWSWPHRRSLQQTAGPCPCWCSASPRWRDPCNTHTQICWVSQRHIQKHTDTNLRHDFSESNTGIALGSAGTYQKHMYTQPHTYQPGADIEPFLRIHIVASVLVPVGIIE